MIIIILSYDIILVKYDVVHHQDLGNSLTLKLPNLIMKKAKGTCTTNILKGLLESPYPRELVYIERGML